ncbi:MAG: AAA family ATPase [Porticoccaceae bacterium]|nr:AAA family ATPase [Porticoccaceae bacterium]
MKTGNLTTTRDRLALWMQQSSTTMAQVARRTGYNEATISRYLASTMSGNREAVESAITDMLNAHERRQTWHAFYFDTVGTQRAQTLFDLIRETCDIGLVTSPAGMGKTTAAQHYASTHESAILITLTEGHGDNWGIIRFLFDTLKVRNYNRQRHGTKDSVIHQRLAQSERLLIVDNAQRATLSGLRWLFDLYDSTGIPIALIGNPDILTRLAGSDQLSSRIGLRTDISHQQGRHDIDWLIDAADTLLAEMWPNAPQEVQLLAREAVRQEGHLRRLVKQLRIAIRLSDAPAWAGKQAAAFVEARSLIGTPTLD